MSDEIHSHKNRGAKSYKIMLSLSGNSEILGKGYSYPVNVSRYFTSLHFKCFFFGEFRLFFFFFFFFFWLLFRRLMLIIMGLINCLRLLYSFEGRLWYQSTSQKPFRCLLLLISSLRINFKVSMSASMPRVR